MKFLILTCLLLSFFSQNADFAYAQAFALPLPSASIATPVDVTKKDKVFSQIEEHLNAIKTLTASFTQTAGNKKPLTGSFILQRPNKFRLAYDPPTPWLFLSTGIQIIYYDSELEQTTYLSDADLPISFLLEDKIVLEKSNVSMELLEDDTSYYLVVYKQDASPYTFVFSKNPVQFRAWMFYDQQQDLVSVTLSNQLYDVKIDKNVFRFNERLSR